MIKRCPFCGGAAEVIDAPEAANQGAVVVECQKCRASGPVVFGVKEDPKPHAIELWNRRTISVTQIEDASPVALDQAAKDALAELRRSRA